MAYEKHNFESGEKLYASQLNEMDAQIALNEEAAKKAAEKAVSWDEVTGKPFGKEVTDTMSLFAHGVSFEGRQYAITEPFAGPLILGGIYSIRVKGYNSSTGTNYNGLTAVQRRYNEKDYIIVGDLNCVPGLSEIQDSAPVAFVIDPDNKPDENGVYGWIFTNNETYNSYPPTVWLYGKCEIINPLPKKYLPDNGGVSSWIDLEDKPFSSEPGPHVELFNQAVEFTNDEYAITEPLLGPLIVGEEYNIRYASEAEWQGIVAEEIEYDGARYIAVGAADGSLPIEALFLMYPDNKPDANGVYGKIVDIKKLETSPNIRLAGRYEKIEKLDKKYLPDDIPTSGGGGGYVIYLDSSMISYSDDTSVTFTYLDSYDEVAEVAHKGGVVWLDGTNVAEMSGGTYARTTVQAVMFDTDPNMLVLQTVFNGITAMVMCPNGTWTPPTA